MPLIKPAVVIDTRGLGTAGFIFSILGPYNATTLTYPARSQGENPKFTADYTNAVFVTGVTYLFLVSHPVYESEGQLIRVMFAVDGSSVIDTDPAERPETVLSSGSVLPQSLTPQAKAGDVLVVVTDPVSGILSVQNIDLTLLFPALRYGLGLGVTIETVRTVSDTDFNPTEFVT